MYLKQMQKTNRQNTTKYVLISVFNILTHFLEDRSKPTRDKTLCPELWSTDTIYTTQYAEKPFNKYVTLLLPHRGLMSPNFN